MNFAAFAGPQLVNKVSVRLKCSGGQSEVENVPCTKIFTGTVDQVYGDSSLVTTTRTLESSSSSCCCFFGVSPTASVPVSSFSTALINLLLGNPHEASSSIVSTETSSCWFFPCHTLWKINRPRRGTLYRNG